MARKKDIDIVIEYIEEKIYPNSLNEKGKSKISNLLSKYKKADLIKAIDIGYEQYIYFDGEGNPTKESTDNFLDKIGGIAHNNALSPIEQKIRHIKNVCNKNYAYWDDRRATSILNKYVTALRKAGWDEKSILDDLNNEAFQKALECENWSQWRALFESWTESLIKQASTPATNQIVDNNLSLFKEYQILDEIGSGSFGITYLCKDARLDKNFVLKEFSCEMLNEDDNKKFFKKFLDEINYLFDLHHQNIVSIYDYIYDENKKSGIYVMEYVNGSNIEEYLTIHKDHVNSIFKQLIDAFSYLESKNLCHRDVRINNILVNENGEVKLIDFGFVKDISNNQSVHSATKLISYPYDWPEELKQKNQKYDMKTEIYFLGKVFEDLLDRLNISEFKYGDIISRMVSHSYKKRISNFNEIRSIINYIDYKEMDKKFSDLD